MRPPKASAAEYDPNFTKFLSRSSAICDLAWESDELVANLMMSACDAYKLNSPVESECLCTQQDGAGIELERKAQRDLRRGESDIESRSSARR
jgi:hypothetical protein